MASAPAPSNAVFSDEVWTRSRVLVRATWRGGCSTAAGSSDFSHAYSYDPVKNTWRDLGATPFTRAQVSAYGAGEWMFWNGEDNTGYSYDVSTGVWSRMAEAPLSLRSNTESVWSTTTNELIVWGGQRLYTDENPGPGGDAAARDGAAYDPATNTWRKLADAPFAGAGGEVVWAGDRMVVVWPVTQFECDCEKPKDGAALYDPVSNTWATIANPPGVKRFGAHDHAIGPADTFAAFWGGNSGSFGEDSFTFDDGVYLDVRSGGWQPIPALPFPAFAADMRYGMTSWSANGNLFVWGGFGMELDDDKPGVGLIDDGAFFNPMTGTWSMMPEGGPSARTGARAVWTGCDAVVFGGRASDPRTTFQDGKLFRP